MDVNIGQTSKEEKLSEIHFNRKKNTSISNIFSQISINIPCTFSPFPLFPLFLLPSRINKGDRSTSSSRTYTRLDLPPRLIAHS